MLPEQEILFKDKYMKYQFLLLLIAILCGYATANAAAEKSDSVNVTIATAVSNAVAITGDALQQLSIRGINKQMVFDTWTISIREEWLV